MSVFVLKMAEVAIFFEKIAFWVLPGGFIIE